MREGAGVRGPAPPPPLVVVAEVGREMRVFGRVREWQHPGLVLEFVKGL